MASLTEMEEPPLYLAIFTYVNYVVLYIFGLLRDTMRALRLETGPSLVDPSGIDFVPLFQNFESFYTRYIYSRVRDCFSRPVISAPGAKMIIKERIHENFNANFRYSGKEIPVINFGSYNYLGFAETGTSCGEDVKQCIKSNAIANCSAIQETGYTTLQRTTERKVARFLGTDDAIVFGMGFATNSTNIATLVGKNCLVLSDECNHSSIVLGCRLSQATIRVFRHCDMEDLEDKLRSYIVEGNPRNRRPWKKILIIVEGIYSMEGTIVPLPELIALKKKYRAYLFLDEAHSIGAIGPRARGVVDYYSCNPTDVDVLMGTFTKSFNSCGGYVAGRKSIIKHIRKYSHAQAYATSMSPPIMQQICSVIDILDGKTGNDDGSRRIKQLAYNTQYLRRALKEMNFIVYGDDDSPVVPVMLFATSKIAAFNREMLKRQFAVVTVGFPATPLTLARVRFCVSSAHSQEMLDELINNVREVGDLLNLRVSRRKASNAVNKKD